MEALYASNANTNTKYKDKWKNKDKSEVNWKSKINTEKRVRFKVKGGKVEDGWRPQMHEMQIQSKIQNKKDGLFWFGIKLHKKISFPVG